MDDADDDWESQQGPAPKEWIERGWVDYSEHRRQPYPGENPWFGWVNYTETELQKWAQHQVAKAVRLAERGEDGDEPPSGRSPSPKKVKAPSSPVSLSSSSDTLIDMVALLDKLQC